MDLRNLVLQVGLAVLLTACSALAQPVDPPDIDGILGLETEDGHGWMAIKVDFDESSALSGVMWYSNDSSVNFPTVMVGTGFESGPGVIGSFLPVAGALSGQSDEWSECTFTEPVAASLGGLYVTFEFPVGSSFTRRGFGGGPGIGYSEGLTEPHGWVSGDGETWHPLAGDFGLAVLPILIPFNEGMALKSLDGGEDSIPEIPDEYYTSVGPNPFNPQVMVRFGLPVGGRTEITVFDVRGRRIERLLSDVMIAGHHEVVWQGRDEAGRKVSSGTYFVRIVSGSLDTVQRVMMVK